MAVSVKPSHCQQAPSGTARSFPLQSGKAGKNHAAGLRQTSATVALESTGQSKRCVSSHIAFRWSSCACVIQHASSDVISPHCSICAAASMAAASPASIRIARPDGARSRYDVVSPMRESHPGCAARLQRQLVRSMPSGSSKPVRNSSGKYQRTALMRSYASA